MIFLIKKSSYERERNLKKIEAVRKPPVFCQAGGFSYLCRVSKKTDQEYLDELAAEIDRELIAQEIIDAHLNQARKGDVDSLKILSDLARESRESKLRKDLFGV